MIKDLEAPVPNPVAALPRSLRGLAKAIHLERHGQPGRELDGIIATRMGQTTDEQKSQVRNAILGMPFVPPKASKALWWKE